MHRSRKRGCFKHFSTLIARRSGRAAHVGFAATNHALRRGFGIRFG